MDAKFEASVRFKRGMDLQQLTDELVAEGCEAAAAHEAVMAVQKRITAEDRRRGFQNLFIGLVILGVGAVITIGSMMAGNVFILAYGALLAGGAMIVVGIGQITSAGQDREMAQR